MKVSIITSCYNREATIRGAIESVLEQDYPYIEYIVVDGASKDNSLAVINEYKNGIDTIISEPDKGMYEAINKGIRAATGDIIGLIHSDDFLFSSHTISDIVKTFEEQDADMIYGNGVFVDYDDTNQMIRNWISGRYSKENVKNGWLPLHPTVYIKKECMDKWGLYNESYKIAADSDLLVRYLYEADLKVYYLNKVTTKKRNAERYSDRIELQGFQSCFRLFVKPSQSPLKPNQDAATLLVRNHARNGDKRTRITKQGVKD